MRTEIALFGLALGMGVRGTLLKQELPTITNDGTTYDAHGMSPKPTTAPRAHDLRRRDLVEGETRYVAESNICGYIGAESSEEYACQNSNRRCAFLTADSRRNGKILCCDRDGFDCAVPFERCFSRSQAVNEDRVDSFALSCTAFASPYCATVSIAPGISDYFCRPRATFLKAWLTYDGQEDRVFTAFYIRDGTTTSSVVTNSLSSITGETKTDTSTTDIPTTPGPNPNDDDDVSGPKDGDELEPKPQDKDKVPVGPIVGGVIGGVAAILIVALAAFFFMRRKAKAPRGDDQPTVVMQQPQEPQQPQPQPQPQLMTYNDYPKNYSHQAQQPYSPTQTVSSPTSTDPRVSCMSGPNPPLYMDEVGAPVYEAPARPNERRENERQEMA